MCYIVVGDTQWVGGCSKLYNFELLARFNFDMWWANRIIENALTLIKGYVFQNEFIGYSRDIWVAQSLWARHFGRNLMVWNPTVSEKGTCQHRASGKRKLL